MAAGAVPLFTVTVADALVLPPLPVQSSVYVAVEAGETTLVPVRASVPVQPPLAVQEDAFVLDQVRVDEEPTVMELELAVRLTVGAGVGAAASTVIFSDARAAPPAPEQVTP